MQALLTWLNINKSSIALVAALALQTAQANGWMTVPTDVLNTLTGLAAGAGLGTIPHSNAAGFCARLKAMAPKANP